MTRKRKDSQDNVHQLGKEDLTFSIPYLHIRMDTIRMDAMTVDSDREEEQPEPDGEMELSE